MILAQVKFVIDQLLSSVPYGHSVPYAMVRLCSLYTEQSINYFGQKLTSFFKFYKFQPLNFFFFEILVYQQTRFKI